MATATATEWQVLKFQAWASAPDVGFWQALASLKLHKFQLDDQPQVRPCGALGRRQGSLLSRSGLTLLLRLDDRTFPVSSRSAAPRAFQPGLW